MSPTAVVLLSGGLDSATCLLIARAEGFETRALSFDYGQRHAAELDRARAIAVRYGVREHRVVQLDFPGAGASALTDLSIAVPHDGLGREPIPITYVPARNTLFLAHALAWAETLGAGDIFIGANALDYSGYPDCRPEFLDAFSRMANLGTKAGVEGRIAFRIRGPFALHDQGRDRAKGGRPRARFRAHPLLLRPGGRRDALRLLRLLPSQGKGVPRGRPRGSSPERGLNTCVSYTKIYSHLNLTSLHSDRSIRAPARALRPACHREGARREGTTCDSTS